jgi:hypothetical protein
VTKNITHQHKDMYFNYIRRQLITPLIFSYLNHGCKITDQSTKNSHCTSGNNATYHQTYNPPPLPSHPPPPTDCIQNSITPAHMGNHTFIFHSAVLMRHQKTNNKLTFLQLVSFSIYKTSLKEALIPCIWSDKTAHSLTSIDATLD